MKDPRSAIHEPIEMPIPRDSKADGAIDAEALFRAHARFVASVLARMGVPRAELDDAVQEVFLVAHRKGGYLPGPAQPRSWLAAIAVHIAQAGRRSWRRRPVATMQAIESRACETPDPASRLETQRALEAVQHALDQLPLELRAVFVLYEIEGEACESIAATWSIPLGTVYSRLHNARKRFMQAYGAGDDAKPKIASLSHPEVSR